MAELFRPVYYEFQSLVIFYSIFFILAILNTGKCAPIISNHSHNATRKINAPYFSSTLIPALEFPRDAQYLTPSLNNLSKSTVYNKKLQNRTLGSDQYYSDNPKNHHDLSSLVS